MDEERMDEERLGSLPSASVPIFKAAWRGGKSPGIGAGDNGTLSPFDKNKGCIRRTGHRHAAMRRHRQPAGRTRQGNRQEAL
jgi:hypothetical protein